MALLVLKFGGTSVGSIARIREVAKLALEARARGDQAVLVVSAMSGETNRLVALASEINPLPFSREYDMLVASGEQISAGLVALAINTEAEARGKFRREGDAYLARPWLGHQIGIRTDSVFSKARIQAIDATLLKRELEAGKIPVIAGFQGVDPENNITTLGRGGSDTSAVAIAAALGADDCLIYTDVDGVYTADPRAVPRARKMKSICYEEMMELASLGAKVLQIRSVELAAKHAVPLQVLSSFERTPGTRVVSTETYLKENPEMEQVTVAGVAADAGQVKFTLQELKDGPGIAARVFGALSQASVVVDVIVQDVPSNGKLTLSFTVGPGDHLKARQVLDGLRAKDFPSLQFAEKSGLSKVSIVGVGMQHHPGVAAKMFELLAGEGINIHLITTSEIKISCLVEDAARVAAMQRLHSGFGLDRD